ncbi:MAG TPA: hypothetical protein VGR94_08170 [Candidatus Acidoferrales bacterium]|nr:hypothetical protein [Candidatus Acidoferrales bacterium]
MSKLIAFKAKTSSPGEPDLPSLVTILDGLLQQAHTVANVFRNPIHTEKVGKESDIVS